VVLAVVLSACGGSPAGTTPSGPSVLRIGIGTYPASFNSNLTPSAPATTMYQAMFDTLTESNSTKSGAVSPRLATSWSLIDDRTWEFKLRNDVKWHDGSPFTADDVVATIDLLLNGKPASYYAIRMVGVTGAEAVDKYTVRFKMSTKNAFIPIGAEDVYIYQAAVIKAGGNDGVNKNPIGTGPFKLKSKEDGVSVTLERNPDYWGTKPKLDQIVFRALTEDGTRMAALESGEIDIAFNVPADDAKRLGAKGIDIKAVAVGQSMVLNMKMINPATPLANKKVRQALNYAIDKDALQRDVLLGFGEKLKGQVVGADATGFNDKLAAYPYDPAKAKALLTEAGYPNGFAVTFYTSQGRYAKQKEVSEAIAGQLKNIGLDVKLQVLEWGAYFSGLPTYDVNLVGYNYFPAMDADYVLLQFLCSSYFKVMCNPSYDALLAQARSEADPSKRAAILQQMQQILNEEAPVVFLYQSPDIFGVAKRVKGFTATPDDLIHVLPISVN
jgi:peptide/nickel transport system substrate-binding protein